MECQICLTKEGKHLIQVEGLCGEHAQKLKEVLEWFCENKESLEKLDLKGLTKKFEK